MNKAKITPTTVLEARLAQLKKEREEIIIDLERDVTEEIERGSNIDPEIIRDDRNFWNTEIYKYDFCIDEVERIIKMFYF